MLAKRVCLIVRATPQVFLELKLLAQFFARPNLLCLTPLLHPNHTCRSDEFLCLPNGREDHAVDIREDNIFACHSELTKSRRTQCLRMSRIESLRTCGISSITKNRKSNLMQFHTITVTSPDDDACQPACLRFQHCQVPDTAFVHPALIIDNEDIASLDTSHHLEEDVHAAIMFHGQGAASNMAFQSQWTNAKRSHPQRDAQAQTGICNQRCGKLGERFIQMLVVHGIPSLFHSPERYRYLPWRAVPGRALPQNDFTY